MENNGILVVFIVLFVFCIWVYTGGPNHPISFAGPYLTPITNVNQTSVGYGKGDSYLSTTGVGTNSDGSYDQGTIHQRIAEIQDQVKQLQLYGVSSPYRGRVSIQNVSTSQTGRSTRSEYVTIYASSGAPVDITGWKLVSAVTKSSATIPSGERIPRSTHGGSTQDIMLDGGMSAIITTGDSPRDTSFLENECTGYFEEKHDYIPSLSTYSCPTPRDELGSFYRGSAGDYNRCSNYVNSLQTCREPSGSHQDAPSSCVDFLDDRLSYSGCLKGHESDANFLGTTWRVYLEKGNVLWRSSNDTVKLLDANGQTVDVYQY